MLIQSYCLLLITQKNGKHQNFKLSKGTCLPTYLGTYTEKRIKMFKKFTLLFC